MKCRCCSGNAISRLNIAGRYVQVLGLPALFEQFHRNGRSLDEMFKAVRVYNVIPAELEGEYRAAVMRAFADYAPHATGSSSNT